MKTYIMLTRGQISHLTALVDSWDNSGLSTYSHGEKVNAYIERYTYGKFLWVKLEGYRLTPKYAQYLEGVCLGEPKWQGVIQLGRFETARAWLDLHKASCDGKIFASHDEITKLYSMLKEPIPSW